jgi:hypothetical protein
MDTERVVEDNVTSHIQKEFDLFVRTYIHTHRERCKEDGAG